MIRKKGSANWKGSLKEGTGTISTESGVLDEVNYGFNKRFEGAPGSNPEELIGAAHASCFSMALSMMLGEEGIEPDSIKTDATVIMEQDDSGFLVSEDVAMLEALEADAVGRREYRLAAQLRDTLDVLTPRAGGPLAHMNHLEASVRTALELIGIEHFHEIAIEYQEEGGERLDASVRDALAEVNLLVEFEDGSQIAGHSTSPDTVEAAAKAFVAAVNKYKLTQGMKKVDPASKKGGKGPSRLRGV